jgi:H+/Cl- antiporter ClcA/CBS domain-containing protein
MKHDDQGAIADPQFHSPSTEPSPSLEPHQEPSISPIRVPILAPVVNRLQASPETIVLLLAVLVGGGGGLCVVLFRYLIGITHDLLLENLMGELSGWGSWTLALIPIIGGAMVGLLRWQVKDFGQGLAGLRTAIAGAQDISALRPVVKALAAVLSLGSGASLGPEGPSVEIGANFGVLLGQALQVSKDRQQLLLGAGAAAGVAAGFNAPIAGVFFALEVALGTSFATSAVSVVLLSAVLSSLVAQIGLGSHPAFSLPIYEVRSPLELPLYLGLGVFASLTAVAYTRLNKWMPKLFRGEVVNFEWIGRIPREVQPMIGGAIVGIVALGLPQILGIGYETVEAVLRDVEFPFFVLLLMVGAKLLLASLSLGSGLVGGIFAPSMFLGASLGAAYGQLLPIMLPWFAKSIAAPPAYAMVGMAAVLAGSARAPLTAILLMFELTRDYRIVLPLMAAVGISFWLFEFFRTSEEQALMLANPEGAADEDDDRLRSILSRLQVKDVMQVEGLRLAASRSVLTAGMALTEKGLHCALIVDASDQLMGIITLRDIDRAIGRWQAAKDHADKPYMQLVGEICTQNLLSAYDDELVTEALDRMAARGLHQLPVIDRDNPQVILGILNQDTIDLACSLALTRESIQPYLSVTIPDVLVTL